MGAKYSAESIIFVLLFLFIVAVPCVFVSILGSRMINDMGNAPSNSARIGVSACWKVLLAEIFSFALFALFFHIFK